MCDYDLTERPNKKSDYLLSFTLSKNDENKLKIWTEKDSKEEWVVKTGDKQLRFLFHNQYLQNPFRNDQNSIYHPFYPETFYGTFEVIEVLKYKTDIFRSESNIDNLKITVICNEDCLGTLEAMLLQSEINFDAVINNLYVEPNPASNILKNIYQFTIIDKIKPTDIIFIDVLSIMEDAVTWKSEEHDFQLTVNWVIGSIHKLSPHKTMIVKMRHLCHLNWILIMKIMKIYFKSIQYFHPRGCDESDSQYYIIGFDRNEQIVSDKFLKMRRIYCYDFWKFYHLTIKYTEDELAEYRAIEDKKNMIKKEDPNVWLKKMGLFVQLKSDPSLQYINIVLRNVNSELSYHLNQWNGISSKSAKMLQLTKRWIDSKPIIPLFPKTAYKKFVKNAEQIKNLKLMCVTEWMNDVLYSRTTEYMCWENVKKRTNPFKALNRQLSDHFGGEMITNAWMKFYEILASNQRLTRRFPNMVWKSCHLGEAPGAFIASLNHYLRQEGTNNVKWYWTAQSFLDEKALGDQFKLMQQYPKNWIIEQNGDLTNPDVIRAYHNNKFMHHPDLMTADGALSLNPDQYGMEEKLMMKLFLGELITILGLLSPDGCAVIKFFLPMTESLTLSLLYIMKHHFERISIQKPVTSRVFNSEIYIIMEGYKPMVPADLELLLGLLERENLERVSLIDIDSASFRSFLVEMEGVRDQIIDKQINGLIHLYHNFYYPNQEIVLFHEAWMNKYLPAYLKRENKLIY